MPSSETRRKHADKKHLSINRHFGVCFYSDVGRNRRQSANHFVYLEPVTRFDPALNRFVASPIEFGEASEQLFLLLYGTGLRHQEGQRIKVTFGEVETSVRFVGAVEGFAGLDQINLSLPRSLAGRGEIEIKLTIDDRSANVVNVVIR